MYNKKFTELYNIIKEHIDAKIANYKDEQNKKKQEIIENASSQIEQIVQGSSSEIGKIVLEKIKQNLANKLKNI